MDGLHDRMEGDLCLRRLSANTSVTYLGCVARFEEWQGRSAAELGRAEVLAFLTWLVRDRGVSASTQAVYLAALRFIYGVTLSRPEVVAGIPWPKQPLRLPAALSRSEIGAILARTPLLKHRVTFLAGYSAGLRASEVAHLRSDDVDAARGVLRVRKGKGNRDREALLPPILLDGLQAYRRQCQPPGPYLFPKRTSTGEPMRSDSISAAFRNAVARAGLSRPEVRYHSLRAAFASHLLEDGVSLPVIQRLLGHTSLRTTARYLRVSSRVLAEVRSPAESLQLTSQLVPAAVAEHAFGDMACG